MIGLALGVKVFLCTAPTDMRRGFDGLSGMAESLTVSYTHLTLPTIYSV